MSRETSTFPSGYVAKGSDLKNLFHLLLKAPMGLAVCTGPTSAVEFVNDHTLEIWGKKREAVLGRPLLEVFPELGGDKFDAIIAHVQLNAATRHIQEYKVDFSRHGKPVTAYFDLVLDPIQDTGDAVSGFTMIFTDVTEEVINRKMVHATEERLDSLLTQAPVGIVVYRGADFVVEFVNKQVLDMWGKGLEEVKGRAMKDIFPEITTQQRIQALYDASVEKFARGEAFIVTEAELTFQRNGQLHTGWYTYTHEPLRDLHGRVNGIIAVAHEVTDQVLARKRIEESQALLRITKEQLELSINAGRIGVWQWNVKTDVRTWSKEQLEIYGLSADEFTGTAEDFLGRIHPDDRAKVDDALRIELKTPENQYEFRIRQKNGNISWIQSRSKTFFDHEGNPEFITGVNIDISEQKEAEKQLEFAATLTENIADAVIATATNEDNFKITSWNKGAEKIYGWKAEEVVGKPAPEILQTVIAEDGQSEMQWKQLLETGFMKNELVQKHKDGTLLHVHSSLALVRDEKGDPIGIVAVNSDIGERNKMEHALRNAKEQLELTFKNIPSGVFLISKNAEILFANDSAALMSGYASAAEMMQAKDPRVVVAKILATYDMFDENGNVVAIDATPAARALKTATPHEAVLEIRKKNDKSTYWVLAKASPLLDANGGLSTVLAISTDITAQKLGEQKIRASEDHYKRIFEGTPVSIWEEDFSAVSEKVLDLKQHGVTDLRRYFKKHPDQLHDLLQKIVIRDINTRTLLLLGASNKDEVKRGLQQIFLEDTTEAFLSELEVIANGGGYFSYETAIRSLEGERIEVLVQINFPRSGDFSHVLVTVLDISERKKADLALRRSEERFRFLFDSNVLPVAFWKVSGEIYDANPAFLDLLGYTREDMQEGRLSWREFTVPEAAAIHEEKVLQAIEGKTIAPYETQYVSKKGERISSLVGYAMLTGSKERGIAFLQDIRKIKETENALRHSEEKYKQLSNTLEEQVNQRTSDLVNTQNFLQQLIDASVEFVLVLDRDLNIITINKAFENGMNAKRHELKGHNIFDITPDARNTVQHESMLKALKGETVYLDKRAAVSNPNYFLDTYFLPLVQNEQIEGVIVMSRDVTEIVKSKLVLENKIRELNEAQQIAQLGSWEWNLETGEVTWSEQMYRIYGYGEERFPVTFEKAIERMPEAVRERTINRMKQHVAEAQKAFYDRGQTVFHNSPSEYSIVMPDSSEKFLRGAGKMIVSHQGKVSRVIGTVQDITEQKRSESRLIEANETLEQRNQFVEKLINSSLDLIMVVDRQLRFITLNKRAETAIRTYYDGELIGRKITEINASISNSELYLDLLRAFRGEIIIRDRVKSTLSDNYYEHNYVPLQNPAGDVYAVMVISHDITESIKQVEELTRLSESDKLKSDFIKMASHELKTPVTSIKGYTQLMLDAIKNEENKTISPLLVRSSLTSIDKQVTRLTRLMSELLDLSKIEAGMLELHKELFVLNEIVIDTVQDILYTNSKHAINVFHDFECFVYADKDRISQVLINFLTNAVKYSPNADRIEVWVRQSERRQVSVSVKDYGIGIDLKDQDKIFDRFYRVQGKDELTYPGFGIGLSIAREIIQRHQGTIYLDSEKGKGSVFTFTLPVAPPKNVTNG